MSTPGIFTLELLNQITSFASAAVSLRDYVERLVTRVHDVMGVKVSSLYLAQQDRSMHLIASVGLAARAVDAVSLPPNRGLVGAIARTRAPLNIADAHLHPDFVYLAETEEDPNSAFLGVPIVHLGNVIGVLVVQDDRDEPFSGAEESFLVTVAAQLAGSLAQWREYAEANVDRQTDQYTIHGIVGAPGVAIGRVHLVLSPATLAAMEDPPSRGPAAELAGLRAAVAAAAAELDATASQLRGTVSSEVIALYDVYRSLVVSEELIQTCEQRIRGGASAFGAVRSTIDDIAAAFDALEDAYLRSRAEDLHHIGNKILGMLAGPTAKPPPDARDLILVGSLVSITDIAQLQPDQIAAILTTEGSGLSHTAVLARALGIPAIMGLGHLEHIRADDVVVVDADAGMAIFHPEPAVLDAYRHRVAGQAALQDELATLRDLPAVTPDGVHIRLLVNTGLLADAGPGLRRGAEGVGLYRSEIPFLMQQTFPTENEQIATYRTVLAAYHPLPVTMRILDVGGDKALPYLPIEEDNPLLGWRGIRFALDNPAVVFTQLRAMLSASVGLDNLRVLIPMVTRLREIVGVIELLDAALTALRGEGHAVKRPPVGIMVEVPGAVSILPELAKPIDFISIGTNDLTQYLLAVDRGNPRVASHFDHLHPAVIRTIRDVVDTAAALQLDCTVCGEMAADPHAVPILMGLGVRSLSMNAHSLPLMKRLILAISLEDAERLAAEALSLGDEGQIRAIAASLIGTGTR